MSRSPLPASSPAASAPGRWPGSRRRWATGRVVRLALELIRALGLLAGVGTGVTVACTRLRRTTWRADEPSARFADLAVAWWGLPVTPSVTHDGDGKAIPAIGGRSADGAAMVLRWAVLDTVAALPPGTGLASIARWPST